MQQVVDFIEDYITNIVDYTLTVVSFSSTTNSTTIVVKNLLHAKERLNVTIDGNEYAITSVDISASSITIGTELNTVDVVVLQAPYYFHGTPKQVNLERSNNVDEDELYPFVWLYEIL